MAEYKLSLEKRELTGKKLKSLREKGIISYKVHPVDNRKKIFFLNSKYIGSVDMREPKEIEQTQSDYLIKNLVEEDEEFSTLLFHTLKSMLIQQTEDIAAYLEEGFLSEKTSELYLTAPELWQKKKLH